MKLYPMSILSQILLIILGLLMFNLPAESSLTIIYMISIMIIVNGVELIVRYFQKHIYHVSIFEVFLGLFLIVFGGYLFFNVELGFLTLPLTGGILLIITGIIKLLTLIMYGNYNILPMWYNVLNIIVSIMLGIILLQNPIITGLSIVMMTGLFFIIIGIFDIISLIWFYYISKK